MRFQKKFERLGEKSRNIKHIKLYILLRNSNSRRKISKHTKAKIQKGDISSYKVFLAYKVEEYDMRGQPGSNVAFSFVYQLKSFIFFLMFFLRKRSEVWSGQVRPL